MWGGRSTPVAGVPAPPRRGVCTVARGAGPAETGGKEATVSVVRVLVVDDQEPFRAAAVAVIEATAGFVVAGVVESGEESLGVVAAGAADLVVMGANLPASDGLTAGMWLGEC